MPELDIYFSGEIYGANITTVAGPQGNSIDVSGLTPEELVRKLRTGEYTITLGNYLYQKNQDAEVDMNFRPAVQDIPRLTVTFTEEQAQYLTGQRRAEGDCDLDAVIGGPRKTET